MKKLSLIPILSLLLLPAAIAFAGEGEKAPQKPDKGRAVKAAIAEYDKDGDGKLTARELGLSERFFSLLDKDGDGFVTARELAGPRGRRGPQPGGRPGPDAAARMDADGDGRISHEEWKGRPEMFARLDEDGDNFLTKDELKRLYGKAGRREGAPGDAGGRRLLRGLKKMDADGDGTVTREEWKGPEGLFDRLDRNGDGAISEQEVKRVQKEMQQRFRGGAARGDVAGVLFRTMDRDRDGAITREEWRLKADLFDKLDADGDGAIRKGEIAGEPRGEKGERQPPATEENFFELFDKNGDGKVTRKEYTGPAKLFERLDRNHDGVVDSADRLRGT